MLSTTMCQPMGIAPVYIITIISRFFVRLSPERTDSNVSCLFNEIIRGCPRWEAHPALVIFPRALRVTTVTTVVGPTAQFGIALIDVSEQKSRCSFSYAKDCINAFTLAQ